MDKQWRTTMSMWSIFRWNCKNSTTTCSGRETWNITPRMPSSMAYAQSTRLWWYIKEMTHMSTLPHCWSPYVNARRMKPNTRNHHAEYAKAYLPSTSRPPYWTNNTDSHQHQPDNVQQDQSHYCWQDNQQQQWQHHCHHPRHAGGTHHVDTGRGGLHSPIHQLWQPCTGSGWCRVDLLHRILCCHCENGWWYRTVRKPLLQL